MEPKGGMDPFGGPPGGPGASGKPSGGPGSFGGPPGSPNRKGGPPGGPEGPREFGPGTFIAPVVLKQGDSNHDSRLSLEEFQALGRRWFEAWDTDHTGKLNPNKIRDGLNDVLAPPAPIDRPDAGMSVAPMPGLNFTGPEGKRNGVLGVMGMEFPWVHADLDFAGQSLPNVSVRYKGNGTFLQSRGSLKRSLKVDVNKDFPRRKFGGVSKLNFHSNVTDASWMNEVLSYRLFRDAGVPAPRTAYARVYLTVPGKYGNTYVGLYSLVENVDKNFAIDRFGTKKGSLFKPVSPRPFEDLGDDWKAYRQAYDPKTPVSNEETQRVIAFCKLVSHSSDAEFAQKLERFLDLDEFARFMAMTTWLSTMDSLLAMGQNYLVYLHPKTHQFQFIPWDLDHSFGQFFPIGTPQQRENLSIHKPWAGNILFLDRVYRIDKFKRLYLARLEEFNKTICNPERIQRQVDELAGILRSAVQEESAEKLARFDKVVAGEPVGPAGFEGGFDGLLPKGDFTPISAPDAKNSGSPSSGGFPGPHPQGPDAGGPQFGPPGLLGQPVKPIKGFVTARAKSVTDQLAGKEEGTIVSAFGFGGPGPLGGPGGPKAPSGFGPGMFLGPIFMAELDADKNGSVTEDEFARGFQRWFTFWDTDKSGVLTEDQLHTGLNKVFSPFIGGPPGGPGFGPPGELPDGFNFKLPEGPPGGFGFGPTAREPPPGSADDRGK
jgi:spore coat protein H